MSKPHSKPEDRDQLAAQVVQIRKRLELGKTSAALKDAKDLAKRVPGDASSTLLADCYAARIVDLQRGGQETEATQLLAIARERFADAAGRWDDLVNSGRRRTGDFGDVLVVLADETSTPEQRERAEATLRAELADPRLLCDAEQLPKDHELRVAARAVSDAFVEAARGALSDTAREAMRTVARRSPLAPWRAFVLALDAFHRCDDDAMLEQLDRIPDDAAPAPLAQALRDRFIGRPPKTPLAERLDGGVSALLHDLAALHAAVQSGTASRAGAMVVPIVRGLAAFEPRLASRFLRWLDMQTEKAVPTDAKFFATIRPLLPDGELERLHAGTFDEQDPTIGFLAWTDWLWPRSRKSLRPLNDDELALLLDRLVTVADRAFARIAPVLVEHRVPSKGVLPLPEANQFGRSLYEIGDRGSDTESAADQLIALATVVQALLTRVDAADVVVRGTPPGFAFAALACRLQPTPERYRTWSSRTGWRRSTWPAFV